MTTDRERDAELAYQDVVLDSEDEAHAFEWPDGCDANCRRCQSRLELRCADGHEWPPEYTSGDTCWCGAFYLTQLPDGRMKVTESIR